CKLGSNEDVEESCGAEEPGNTTHCRLAIEACLGQFSANLALAQIDADRNQRQPSEENRWKNEKYNDAHVRIVHVAANLLRQHKEPRNQSSREQGHAQQTQPMSRQHEPCRLFTRYAHRVRRKSGADILALRSRLKGAREKKDCKG